MYVPGVAVQVHKIVLGKPTGRRRGEFPAPRFSARCVCCDATSVEHLPYDPSSDDQHADRITVPLCSACRRHVSRRPALGTMLVGLPAGLGIFLLLGALVISSMSLLVAALLLIIVPIVLAVVHHRERLAAASHGHHRELRIGVGAGFSVVTTTNPRIRDELLGQGGRPLQRRGA
jgi:hypothetical protein